MNIAILTNFQEFNPGYSLTGIVIDQARMLVRNGETVHLYVCEKFNSTSEVLIEQLPEFKKKSLFLHKVIPFSHLVDYETMFTWSVDHQKLSVRTAEVLEKEFSINKIEVAFTHDWIFTGWNLPFAGAIRFVSFLKSKIGWLHWVHSVPSANRDWWNLSVYGPNHRIVFPNSIERNRVAEQFRTTQEKVLVIPHIKDPRIWFDFCQDSWDFIDRHPGMMTANMVQVYPASSDRLSAKGIERVIDIFAAWKNDLGLNVCLVIANQWATGRQRKEDIGAFYEYSTNKGLVKDKEFIFTSEENSRFSTGIHSRMLRELQLLSNVFIFPTREESFGLVGPESAFSGTLPILNNSLSMMKEVFSNTGLYYDFGSFHQVFEPLQGWETYCKAVAMQAYHQFINDQTIMAKTACRMNYNMENLYKKHYRPAIEYIKAMAQNWELAPDEVEMVKMEMENIKN